MNPSKATDPYDSAVTFELFWTNAVSEALTVNEFLLNVFPSTCVSAYNANCQVNQGAVDQNTGKVAFTMSGGNALGKITFQIISVSFDPIARSA